MSEHQAARTLVKSAPELWEACSEESSLARHLRSFGEIRITRLEPETAVAWEGDRTSGTVRLEPSGWGTRVTLTARAIDAAAGESPAVREAQPQPVAEPPVQVVEPPAKVVGPPVQLVEPPVQLVEPPVQLVEPPVQVGEPPVLVEPPAQVAEPPHAHLPIPEPAPDSPEPTPAPHRPGFWERLFGRRRAGAMPEPAAIAMAEPQPAVEADPLAGVEPALAADPPSAPDAGVEPALAADPASAPDAGVEPASEPAVGVEPAASAPALAVEPGASAPDSPAEPLAEFDPVVALTEALDSLGRAHHRPFSRG